MRISTFMKKASMISGKETPSAFLKKHRIFLSGFTHILPVLVQLDKGLLFPTPALQRVLTLLALEEDPEASVETVDPETGEVRTSTSKKEEEKESAGKHKPYLITIFANKGTEIVEEYESALFGDAERIAHRKLFHNEDSTFALIIGFGITTKVGRDEAMKALLARGPGGVQSCKNTSSMSSLSIPSAKNSVSHFSRG